MITVAELDSIDLARLDDAKALPPAGRFDGATYLCGFQTHELDVLLRLSGQEARIRQTRFDVWSTAAVWKAESRYRRTRAVAGTDRFSRVEAQTAREKGDLVLFALFMREEVPDRWDPIVSAPWAWSDKQSAVRCLVDQIKSVLGSQEHAERRGVGGPCRGPHAQKYSKVPGSRAIDSRTCAMKTR
jgi:hypothetical protein